MLSTWNNVSETVGVLRAELDASELVAELSKAGFATERIPLFAIELIEESRPQIAAAAGDPDHWLVCPSANSVRAVLAARSAVLARVAVIGSGTEAAARLLGCRVDHVAPAATAVHLARSLPVTSEDEPVLVPQSTIARPDLLNELRARRVRCRAIDAYRSVPTVVDQGARRRLASCSVHLLTAPSVVERLADELDLEQWCADGGRLIAIGPTTASAARDRGLPVAAVAEPHNVVGLVRATKRIAR